MYQLFTDHERNYGGLLGDADLVNIEKRTVMDVNSVVDYYRYGTFFTRSDHLLAKLINTVATPLSYDPDRYFEVTKARALFVANALQLTSSINRGRWFLGNFYFGCPELVIAYTRDDQPMELLANWRDLTPVKVLECPISNLRYLPPTGMNYQTERGLVVISVDITMLMMQYYGFMQDQYQRRQQDSSHSLLTTHHFVGKYVLPNMIYSQTDRALYNRMFNLQMGLPMGKATKQHPFMVTDYSERLDKKLSLYLDRIQDKRRTYENYLEQIPTIFSDAPWIMPDIAETRQVYWALFLARLKDMEFLIDAGGKNGLGMNRIWINKLKVEIKRFNSDGIFKSVLPEDLLNRQQLLFSEWLSL